MRTTFALYQKYEDAKKAVDQLLDKNFDKEDINIIAQKSAVESAWDINERTIGVDSTKEIGNKNVRGLDAMLGTQQPIRTNTTGELYATGEIAKVLAKTVSVPGTTESGLKSALKDFGMGEGHAATFDKGVRNGSLLIFVRSADERAAEAKDTLNSAAGTNIATVNE